VRIKLGAKELRKHRVTALTVADVLDSMGFDVDRHAKVTPSLDTEITAGSKVVVKDIRLATKKVAREVVDAPVIEREDASMYEGEEEVVDPRYAPAEDALAAGDIDAAVAEYQKLLDANPADVEAAGGLAIAKVMQRTQDVDLNAARAAAADNPDDVDAQTLVADLDMLGGHVEDAFTRLVNLVARTTDKDREKARDHLLGLFAAVGNDDPRVLAGRRNLASALF
jgi:putative thioredoxin